MVSHCDDVGGVFLDPNFNKPESQYGVHFNWLCLCTQSLQVAQKEAQIRLLEGQLRQTDVIGSSHNHMILDALREKAEYIPELQALIHNVQQGESWFLCV